MHQSGRVAIMLWMRSSPQAGSQRVVGDRRERLLAQRRLALVEGDEPLLGGAEDDRVLAAPADRVGVRVLARPGAARPSRAAARSTFGLASNTLLAREALDLGQEAAALVHRAVDVEAVAHAGQVVVPAVAGGGVHDAGAGVERDVVGEHARRVAVDPGMAEAQPARAPRPSPRRAARRAVDGRKLPSARRGLVRSAFASSSTSPLPSTRVEGVLGLGVERERQVGGQRPGRGRPDRRRTPSARRAPGAPARASPVASAPAGSARRSRG